MTDNKSSIVKYLSKDQRSCGYCSVSDASHTYGLHAHTLRVEDYQAMIDRGWRRCGKYCYKPIMDISCCPSYTIRCAAKDFKLSRTQKKILKRFNNFLIHGTVTKEKVYKTADILQPMDTYVFNTEKEASENSLTTVTPSLDDSCDVAMNTLENIDTEQKVNKPVEVVSTAVSTVTNEKACKNKYRKAKQLRIERKRQKLQKLGLSEEEIQQKLIEKKKYPVVKTLEDFLKEPLTPNAAHRLKISLVRSYPRSEEFVNTFTVAFELYKYYQRHIHKEAPEKLTESQFERFLVTSPLQDVEEYGSYHQQYWLDDKLIAVGVIDILPKCVSSVYFFYDPDYSYLSLGTYGALREVEFTRKLSSNFPDLLYYYMGFYIHSCVKMKYKGAFKPSYLLCPEVYTWHKIQECLPKLEKSKYSRLNEDPNARDMNSEIALSDVLILYNRTAMPLEYYYKKKKCDSKECEEIMEYAKLIGKTCAKRMLLYRRKD